MLRGTDSVAAETRTRPGAMLLALRVRRPSWLSHGVDARRRPLPRRPGMGMQRKGMRAWRISAVGALAGLALAGCGGSDALVPGGFGVGSGKLLAGVHFYVGIPIEVRAGSSCSPRPTTARFVVADRGMKVSVRAMDRREGAFGGATLGADSDDDPAARHIRTHAVGDAVFVPGNNQRWYLLGIFSADRPGVYHASRLHVEYACGGQSGSVDDMVAVTLNVVTSR